MESPEGNGSNPPLISISTLLKQSDSAGADDTTKRVRGESLCSNLHELGEPMLELAQGRVYARPADSYMQIMPRVLRVVPWMPLSLFLILSMY